MKLEVDKNELNNSMYRISRRCILTQPS